jgi:hypothetical protein
MKAQNVVRYVIALGGGRYVNGSEAVQQVSRATLYEKERVRRPARWMGVGTVEAVHLQKSLM